MIDQKTIIALIGGAGFIGSELAPRLRESGYCVRVIDKKRISHEESSFEYVQCDIRDVRCLQRALVGCSVIINLAAEHKDDVSPPSLYYDVNVKGSQNICEVAENMGINNIIFTSSVAIYGFQNQPISISSPANPSNHYGKSKLCAEDVYENWQSRNLSSRTLNIIRPTVVFGAKNRGNVHSLIKYSSGIFPIVVGNGNNVKSISYVENLCLYIVRSLWMAPGTYYTLYSDYPNLRVEEFVKYIRASKGLSTLLVKVPVWVALLGASFLEIIGLITKIDYKVNRLRINKLVSTSHALPHFIIPEYRPEVDLFTAIKRTLAQSKGSL